MSLLNNMYCTFLIVQNKIKGYIHIIIVGEGGVRHFEWLKLMKFSNCRLEGRTCWRPGVEPCWKQTFFEIFVMSFLDKEDIF